MTLDFNKLNAGTAVKQTDPCQVFTALKRDVRLKRPLDDQPPLAVCFEKEQQWWNLVDVDFSVRSMA